MHTPSRRTMVLLVAMPLALAINFTVGWAVLRAGLPIYLDAIGTIALTLLFGWRVGAAMGALSCFVGGLANPHLYYFALTQVAIALTAAYAARQGGFRNVCYIVLTGIAVGIVAALVSAPAVALAFGGDDPGGQSGWACFLSGTREHLHASFASPKFWVEPVDKILQCLMAAGLIEALPRKFLLKLDSPAGFLRINKFL